MKYLITGATGLIGKAIQEECRKKGIFIHYLTTSPSKIKETPHCKGFFWNPKEGTLDTNALKGVDAIINLAGASIAKRWTTSYKKEILKSRTQSLQILQQFLRKEKHQVKHLVSASAVGIYPSSETKVYTEDTSITNDSTNFLQQVTTEWEKEAFKIQELGISVAIVRVGLVLSTKGGAFVEMLRPLKWGLGAAFGNGNQWQSWISLTDIARLFVFATQKRTSGILNGVSTHPVSQYQLLKETSITFKKAFFMPNIPSFFLKIILGEMSTLLLEGQKVIPKNTLLQGFQFKQDTLDSFLKTTNQ